MINTPSYCPEASASPLRSIAADAYSLSELDLTSVQSLTPRGVNSLKFISDQNSLNHYVSQGVQGPLGVHSVPPPQIPVMSVKGLGIALKLTFSGTNQLVYPQTWAFTFFVILCIITQMNYLNKALDTFNTAVVSPIYYVMFTSLTILASVIMFKDWDGQDPTQIITELCGFVTILSGTFLLHKTKDMVDGLGRSPKHTDEEDDMYQEGIPLRRHDSSNMRPRRLSEIYIARSFMRSLERCLGGLELWPGKGQKLSEDQPGEAMAKEAVWPVHAPRAMLLARLGEHPPSLVLVHHIWGAYRPPQSGFNVLQKKDDVKKLIERYLILRGQGTVRHGLSRGRKREINHTPSGVLESGAVTPAQMVRENATRNAVPLKCPKALHGQFKRKDKRYPTVILEAVADQQLWFWHTYFGVPGSNNDLNVLYGSPLFDDLLADKAPEVPFQVNGKTYEKCYYLADGIYPQWSTFVKAFSIARDPKTIKFKRVQESARKNIERAFGVLQGRWGIIQQPARAYHMNMIKRIMYCCMILHNMILEDQKFDISEYWHMYVPPESNIQRTWVERCERQRMRNKELRDRRVHEDLRQDIVEHLWNLNNEI
ncbi:probable magnesium transporter NIPA4 [Tanacetum coccineum]